jgi:hypothetical protein
VTFATIEEAKAALDRQPAEHKKPTPPGQPRKPNLKFFEDRGPRGGQGNAGTWQASSRGGSTTGQRGYQSGGASDSEGGRGRGGFGGRGRGRGSDRGGRGGRGRGGFNKGGANSDSPAAASTSSTPAEKPAGDS